jgi:hypothetical protein
MAITTTCPSCNGPLRIPEELQGQRVRCPVCQTIFEAASSNGQAGSPEPSAPTAPEQGQGPEQPLWKNLSLELDKSDPEARKPTPPAPPAPPRAPRATPSSPRKGLVGAVEVKTSMDDEPTQQPSPPAGRAALPAAPSSRRPEPGPPGRPDEADPRSRDYPDDDEDHPIRRGRYSGGYPRRDGEPHRGVLILVLGIVSLAAMFLNGCYLLGVLIGLPLGITAWVLGNGDLRKIKNREMDEEGLGMTQAGWICGMIGVILHSLVLLTCGGFITFFLIMSANGPVTSKPAFAAPPPQPQPVLKDK